MERGEQQQVAPGRRNERLMAALAWSVHGYTALGGAIGLLAIEFAARNRVRAAFIAMALATAIDSSDGTLARLLEVKRRIPIFDGATLDNVVDYETYVIAPIFLMLHTAILPAGRLGLAIACCATLASAYGFCRVDAKTADHFFLGFPSYWNLVAFYLFCFGWGRPLNTAVVIILTIMVFIPIKYIYPNRTLRLRRLTLTLAAFWTALISIVLVQLPTPNPILVWSSFAFIVYYLVTSFVLHAQCSRALNGLAERHVI